MWSPDSRRLLSYRTDSRGAGQYHLVQSVPLNGSTRPVLHSYAYPLPGDEVVPLSELFVFDVEARTGRPASEIRLPSLYYGSPIRPDWVWWDDDAERLYVLARGRGYRSLTLWAVEAGSGTSRVLVQEEGETPIDPHLTHGGRPCIRVLNHGAHVLWFSQRDGWGHLYLYDGASGRLERQLTSGAWAVAELCFVDEVGRWVYLPIHLDTSCL